MLFRHAKQSRDREALRYEGPKLVVAVVVFLGVSAVIPLYNKVVFEGVAGDRGFPYPLTTTLLQLGFTAVCLTAGEVLRRAWRLVAAARKDQPGTLAALLLACCSRTSAGSRNADASASSGESVGSTQSEMIMPCSDPVIMMAQSEGPGEADALLDPRLEVLEEGSAVLAEGTGGGAVAAPGGPQDPPRQQTRRGKPRIARPPAQLTGSVDSRAATWSDSSSHVGDILDQSWIFGPDLWYKMRITMPIGTLFGAKYAVTNCGLKLIPLAPHLLLQATDLMFTVIFAHMINRERLNRLELISCVGSTVGTVLVAYRTNQVLPPGTGLYSIAVNLVSPVLLGLCVTLLRKASHHLLVREAGPFGRVPGMNPVELTAIKLWWSCAVIAPFVILFEDGGLQRLGLPMATAEVPISVFARTESPALLWAALGGGIFILVFQVNMTWMSTMATAVTVGVIGSLKIFPQWVVAVLFARHLDLSITNLTGATMLLGFSLLWAYSRYDAAIADSRLRYKTKPSKRRSESIRRQQQRKTRATSGYGSLGTSSHSSHSEAAAVLARQAP